MTSPLFGALGLGPIDQVAYVVKDLQAALPRYEALFGPFEVAEAPLPDCSVRGERVDCRLKVAVNRPGNAVPQPAQAPCASRPQRPSSYQSRSISKSPHS